MRASSIAASLFAAVVLATASSPVSFTAAAADLGEGYSERPAPYDNGYAEDRYPAPAEDDEGPPPERYSDRYSEAPPPDRDQGPEYEDDGPPRGSIKDGYPVPVPPPRYSEHRPERYACLDQWEIRRRLRSQGWGDLRPAGAIGPVVRVSGRRLESGRVFLLRVDRCSGDILAARPQYLRNFDGYAESRAWPDRWRGRPGY